MKKLITICFVCLSLNIHAFETQDIVMKMVKDGDFFSVYFGSMAQIYKVKATDKAVGCLEKSVKEKKFVKVNVSSDKAQVLSCSL